MNEVDADRYDLIFMDISMPETDGREGLKSLEVLIAAYLAARDGKRIALPLDY